MGNRVLQGSEQVKDFTIGRVGSSRNPDERQMRSCSGQRESLGRSAAFWIVKGPKNLDRVEGGTAWFLALFGSLSRDAAGTRRWVATFYLYALNILESIFGDGSAGGSPTIYRALPWVV